MQHIIKIIIENEAGSLSRVVELFSKRGYNIDSLSVAPSSNSDISHMTIATTGSNSVIEQIIKQLEDIVPVISAKDVTVNKHVARELMLAKITITKSEFANNILDLIDSFRGEIIRQDNNLLVVQLTGDSKYFKTFLQTIAHAADVETVGSGIVGLDY